jgi:hypothetical protein
MHGFVVASDAGGRQYRGSRTEAFPCSTRMVAAVWPGFCQSGSSASRGLGKVNPDSPDTQRARGRSPTKSHHPPPNPARDPGHMRERCAARTWRGLQVAQLGHDRVYRPDVFGLPRFAQTRHYVLHGSKLVGRVADVERDGWEEFVQRWLPDILLIGIKLISVTGVALRTRTEMKGPTL